MTKQPPTFASWRRPVLPGIGRASDSATPWRTADRIVIGLYAVVVAGVTLPTLLYVEFQGHWGLSNALVTALYALYPAGVLLVLLFCGHWADELGRRRCLGLALACSAASAASFLLACSPWVVAVGRVLTGLASGLGVNAATALMVELVPSAAKRRASAASTVVNQLGLALGALTAAALVAYAPWPARLVFAIHLVAVLVGVAVLAFVPETLREVRRRPSLRFRRLTVPVRDRRRFFAVSASAFASFALCGLLAALSPTLVRELLSASRAVYGGLAVALVFAVSGGSQLLWLRVRYVTALRWGTVILVGSLMLMVAGLEAGSLTLYLVSVIVGGVGVGSLFMSSLSLVNAVSDDTERGSINATYFVITFSGLIVPVVGTGLVADRVSQLAATALFGVMISLVAVCAAVVVGGNPPRPRDKNAR